MITARQREAQHERGTLFVEDSEVVRVDAFAGDQFVMRLHAPKCAAAARAGTFLHIQCDPALPMRRPLSIMLTDADCVDILFKVVGEGLRLLAQKRPGDRVNVLGPIGKPFTMSPRRPRTLLIGGGVGIPPMIFLADAMRRDSENWQPVAILGSEIPFPFELCPAGLPVPWSDRNSPQALTLLEAWGIPNRLTSRAGLAGCHDGYVTDLAEHWLRELAPADREQIAVFACGPTPMLEAVSELTARFDLPCQVSLEEFMACAVGGCAGCTVEIRTAEGRAMKRVCVDGPVFDAHSVVWSA